MNGAISGFTVIIVGVICLISVAGDDGFECNCKCRSSTFSVSTPTQAPPYDDADEYSHSYNHWSELVTDENGNIWVEEIEEESDSKRRRRDTNAGNGGLPNVGSPQGVGDRILANPLKRPKSLMDNADKRHTLTIVYDTMCPFSRHFFMTSLWSVIKYVPDSYEDATLPPEGSNGLWQPFRVFDKVDLEFVPYGNYRFDDEGRVECQHGEKECYLNHLHACLIKEIGGKRALNATVCTIYHNTDPSEELGPRCIQKQDQEVVKNCMESDQVVDEVLRRVDRSQHQWEYIRNQEFILQCLG
eukprot:Gregarina_sp_Poly_1__11178@NODE_911_length_5744_cov_65_144619_g649_i0_p3_GENE_NODE_911_length_5744_cov_65_144619_g649_i0NODE_911_length_5744_cov_65_144619_g649_i0_p3_ORF_typecomplete_len300_score40_43GILT/PF03227_16/5_1e20Thioredoxin_4/PF13462_6/0_025Thioredoxin_4/PF13462_6/8_5e02Svs_4_5_6/PF17381_2/0_014_NODE_911_length_5744_cov_65_144619_g649_i035944493